MRIAYVSMDPGIPLYRTKGASNHVREFCSAAVNEGHEVTLFVAREGNPPNRPSFRVYKVGHEPRGDTEGVQREIHELNRNPSLRHALEREHDNSPFDLVYERYSLWSHAAGPFAHQSRIPHLLEVNSPLRREQSEYRSLYLGDRAAQLEHSVFRGADLVVAVSAEVGEYAAEIRGSSEGVLVVPNGVNLAAFRNARWEEPRGCFNIGFVGSLKAWHGLGVLLEAFHGLAAEDEAYRLLIVGDGPMRGEIEAFAHREKLHDRIELAGAVPKDRIPQHLALMHVASAPYPKLDHFYFSPLKVFEYMAAGKAIVASKIGQISELLRHGQTGLLISPDDPDGLAACIRLLRHNVKLRRRLGASARSEAFAHHSWDARVRSILGALPYRKRGSLLQVVS